ncbi:hypothetical protein B0H67DRAFT_581999 [Lasiosphaeris hirsuta]|uniref:Uncharacterized protein n=1 Tax=Lasiosphaeris hirsuta TaxID=260670 RepID=A0AA40AHH9_9PEZI|nr:hypothetical protein B0H67DRAFT_581999 [Lasiosphaeris hirsuta]
MGQPINALASVPQLPEQSMKPAAPVGSSRQPQKPGLDLWEASHTALYPAPAVASGTPGTAEDDKLTSLNDFELFIARAEAQDRAAYRDKRAGGRSPSQRPGVAVFPVVVKPSPHRQYVSVAANPAPSAERAVSSPSTASTAMARGDLSGGEGERNRRSNRHLTSGQAALAGEECQLAQGQGQGRPHRRENGKRASGAPVCGSTNVTEGVPERKTAPRPPPVVVYGVDETFQAPDPRSSQRPRALRKQASIAQKIAEYIRPPKVATATPSPRENQVVAARPYRSVRRPSSIG